MSAMLFKTRRRAMIVTLRDAPEHAPGWLVPDPPGQTVATPGAGPADGRTYLTRGPSARPQATEARSFARRLRADTAAAGSPVLWAGPGSRGGSPGRRMDESAAVPARTASCKTPPSLPGHGRRRPGRARPALMGLFFVAVLCGLFGCATTVPEDALRLSPETLEQRRLQTRRFDGTTEAEILAASAGVLQDLGFNLDESETGLGVLVGSKKRSARDARQRTAALLLDLLIGWEMETHEEQRIRASLVTRPAPAAHSEAGESFFVRITFQRVVWDTANAVSRSERLDEPALYQGFFERLSKSVFLEANKI